MFVEGPFALQISYSTCVCFDAIVISPMHTSQYTICTYTNTEWILSRLAKTHNREMKKKKRNNLSNLAAFLQIPSGNYSVFFFLLNESLYVEPVEKEAYGTDRCIMS